MFSSFPLRGDCWLLVSTSALPSPSFRLELPHHQPAPLGARWCRLVDGRRVADWQPGSRTRPADTASSAAAALHPHPALAPVEVSCLPAPAIRRCGPGRQRQRQASRSGRAVAIVVGVVRFGSAINNRTTHTAVWLGSPILLPRRVHAVSCTTAARRPPTRPRCVLDTSSTRTHGRSPSRSSPPSRRCCSLSTRRPTALLPPRDTLTPSPSNSPT